MGSSLKPIDEDSDVVLESNGVRLSVLNPEISKKLNKFNTSSDGSLTLDQAIQGLITLQKQSNNYKKMLYLMVPVILFLVASVFGVTLLAIKLTKDVQVNSSSSLTTMTGDLVRVGLETTSTDLFDVVWNPMRIGSLDYISVNGTILAVTDTYQTFSNPDPISGNNKCRAIIRTQRLSLVLDEINGNYSVEIDNQYINDTLTQQFKSAIDAWFSLNFNDVLDERIYYSKIVIKNTCPTGNVWCQTKRACLPLNTICPRPTTTKNAASPSAGSHDNGGLLKGVPVVPIEQQGPNPQDGLGW